MQDARWRTRLRPMKVDFWTVFGEKAKLKVKRMW